MHLSQLARPLAGPPGARRPRFTAAVAFFAVLAVLLSGTPAAAAPILGVDLKVLVVTDGGTNVQAVIAQLDREGVPYDLINATAVNRPIVTAAMLATTVSGQPRGRYQAVVMPNEAALSAAERAALAAYETQFKIRQLDAYTWAHPGVGLNYATWSGTIDGMTATITPAAKAAGFGYLAGQMSLDNVDPAVSESFAAPSVPAPNMPAGSTFTPLVTVPVPDTSAVTAGSVVGVYAHDGREEMVVTVALNPGQTHGRALAHGIVEWLTTACTWAWSATGSACTSTTCCCPTTAGTPASNCTVGDDCNPERDPA